ncbi:MAG: hypothetical protein M1835_001253 [Candelina submexicana]|nr:MAG: hypothetical protein M1835_001253 [Candelina submexicana]
MPSPGGLMSAFSPYTDSPNSPAPQKSPRFSSMAQDAAVTLHPPPSPNPPSISSDVPDPSPITSSGTESTEIDDSADESEQPDEKPPDPPHSSGSVRSEVTVKSIDTDISNRIRSDSDETPQSVIHAPQDFKEFSEENRPPSAKWSTPSPIQRSDFTILSSDGKKSEAIVSTKISLHSPVSPPPLSTSISPAPNLLEGATPRAQTRQEAETAAARRQQSSSVEVSGTRGLDQIPESNFAGHEGDVGNKALQALQESEEDINALKAALSECWTLCNTLAGLSSIHRERIFGFGGKGEVQEQAWKCCWKLCQKLYETRDEDHASQVRPTLDLCRDFCQALFEVRQRENELADSVLRVSFELNNHLYNTHDRNLPEAFRERTLDFYITLCHRLMKQRSGLAEETDSLLRACWSLAEMLFSLRQNRREAKPADEELLGSAVQACWELCDLFREGWTQVRPDRGTPRPSQTTFTQTFNQISESNSVSSSSRRNGNSSSSSNAANPRGLPETPTTIFEDTTVSPDEATVPNILVLGPDNYGRPQPRWSSNASTLSGYSQSSQQTTSSTATATTAAAEDINLTRLKLLILKAALNAGYQTHPTSHPPQSLPAFVKTLSSNAFGSQPWQTSLLASYKSMILTDSAFRAPQMLNLSLRRAGAPEVARAVQWMVGSTGQYVWLRDLFRLVSGFRVEEAETRGGVSIQT